MLGIESGSTGCKANTQALVLFYFILLKFFGHSQWSLGLTLDSVVISGGHGNPMGCRELIPGRLCA